MLTAEDVRQRWFAPQTQKHAPGSDLTHVEEIAHGHRFALNMRGHMTYDSLVSRHGSLAAALGISRDELRIERHSARVEDRALVTVITDNPLSGENPYRGPEYVALPDRNIRGAVPMGPSMDGSEAYTVVEDNSGVYGGLFTGEPGSGKSSAFEQVAAGLLHSGKWYPVYCDGDSGAGSSPFMNERMPVAGSGVSDAVAQLEAMEAALETRSNLKNALIEDRETGQQQVWFGAEIPEGYRAARRIKPCAELPGLAWFLDEFSRLLEDYPEFGKRVLRLVKLGRKLAMSVFVASQSLLKPDYGSTDLRGYLASRNLFAFRATSPQQKRAMPDAGIEPGSLPPGGGFAFYAQSGDYAVRMRTRFAEELDEFVQDGAVALDERTGAHFEGLERDPDAARLASIMWLQGQRPRQPVGSSPERVVSAVAEPRASSTVPMVTAVQVFRPVRPLLFLAELVSLLILLGVAVAFVGIPLLEGSFRGMFAHSARYVLWEFPLAVRDWYRREQQRPTYYA